jgi:hypothetical protein
MQSGGISACSCEVLYRGALGLECLSGMPWSKNALPRTMQGVRGQGRGACRRKSHLATAALEHVLPHGLCSNPCTGWRLSKRCEASSAGAGGRRCGTIWGVSGHPGALKSSGSGPAVASGAGCRLREVWGLTALLQLEAVAGSPCFASALCRLSTRKKTPRSPSGRHLRVLSRAFASSHCDCKAIFVRRYECYAHECWRTRASCLECLLLLSMCIATHSQRSGLPHIVLVEGRRP